MMEQNTQLCLKPNVTLLENGTSIGLGLAGKTRFARNDIQAKLLRALAGHALDLAALSAAEKTLPGAVLGPLDLAAFILDFGDYLEES
ncbi:MAG: hypothetical protein LKJ90_06180 [Faecalibacterium sp.]|jgi:hypothetical protein|nr:hypothetical protein [Faecalibacterium sp.]